MAHMITQIRDAILASLNSIPYNVYVDRVHPLERGDLPSIIISAVEENATQGAYGGGLQLDRALTVGIAIYVQLRGDFDAAANAIQLDVEKAMASDTTLGGIVTNVRYVGRTKHTSGDGDTPFCAIGLTYLVNYRTMADKPDIGV